MFEKIIYSFFFFFGFLYSEVLIIIPVYNRPDFIELQYKTLKKFLKDDHRILMFNDADRPEMKRRIEAECEKYGIECIPVPQQLHPAHPGHSGASASFRHGEVLQYAFDTRGFLHHDLVVILDSDMFLLREFSVREYMNSCDINIYSGKYFPLHFGIINMPNLKNKHEFRFPCRVLNDGTFMDVGYDITHAYLPKYLDGMTAKPVQIMVSILETYIEDPSKFTIDQLKDRGYTDHEIAFVYSLIESTNQFPNTPKSRVIGDLDIGFYETNLFLDYRHGSNWHVPNQSVFERKDRLVKDFLNHLVNSSL